MMRVLFFAALCGMPMLAQAANLDGASLGLIWTVPFAGMLLSIALFPLITPHFWHLHYGKVAAFWTLALLLPLTFSIGAPAVGGVLVHALLTEYVPFIILLFALYSISGGILVMGDVKVSPHWNTGLIALGTACASLMGTTGAAMLFIRPLLRANHARKRKVHVVVFFIFLVANIGGGLTPIGDPPLFLGYLAGVDFGWTLTHMVRPVLCASAILLIVFYCLDRYYFAKDGSPAAVAKPYPLRIYGGFNILLLCGVVAAVLLSGMWSPDIPFMVLGTELELQHVVRDLLLLLLAALSLCLTPKQVRAGNDFDWFPMQEVAKLFAGIFITIVPAITILKVGTQGALRGLVRLVSDSQGEPLNRMYFWLTGLLSSVLDNAPTYLVFFNTASGDAQHLMGPMAPTLLAISMGAVFMGANTYVGNAPNFMVRAIAVQRGVAMPGFFAYMLWSGAVLMPLFVLLTYLFF